MRATAAPPARFPGLAFWTQKSRPRKGGWKLTWENLLDHLRRREITNPAAPKATSARDVGSGVAAGDSTRLLKVMS